MTQTVTLAINDLDEDAPTFDSGTTATAINENSGAGQAVYTAQATDPASDGGPSNPVTFSFGGGTDDALFTIDNGTGVVTLTGNPDFETKPAYSFNVKATDAAGNSTIQTVTLAVNNLDELAPSFTSGTTATAIDENSGAGQVVYTATATDSALDVTSPPVMFSFSGGTDDAAFSINGTTGAVTLNGNPDFETKDSYSFDVTATDAAGNNTTQTVTLAINDPNEEPAIQNETVLANLYITLMYYIDIPTGTVESFEGDGINDPGLLFILASFLDSFDFISSDFSTQDLPLSTTLSNLFSASFSSLYENTPPHIATPGTTYSFGSDGPQNTLTVDGVGQWSLGANGIQFIPVPGATGIHEITLYVTSPDGETKASMTIKVNLMLLSGSDLSQSQLDELSQQKNLLAGLHAIMDENSIDDVIGEEQYQVMGFSQQLKNHNKYL